MVAAMSLNAQDESVQPYMELGQLPRLIDIMPAPPSFDSPEFIAQMKKAQAEYREKAKEITNVNTTPVPRASVR